MVEKEQNLVYKSINYNENEKMKYYKLSARTI